MIGWLSSTPSSLVGAEILLATMKHFRIAPGCRHSRCLVQLIVLVDNPGSLSHSHSHSHHSPATLLTARAASSSQHSYADPTEHLRPDNSQQLRHRSRLVAVHISTCIRVSHRDFPYCTVWLWKCPDKSSHKSPRAMHLEDCERNTPFV